MWEDVDTKQGQPCKVGVHLGLLSTSSSSDGFVVRSSYIAVETKYRSYIHVEILPKTGEESKRTTSRSNSKGTAPVMIGWIQEVEKKNASKE